MSSVLVLKSSILGEHSQSNQLLNIALEGSRNIIERDLAANPLPVMDLNVIGSLGGNESELSEEQKAILQLSNQLIEELKAADSVVIAAPMYNFMVPTQLKNWFDLIARAGITFSYTETGPVGLIDNKPVTIVTTRGGLHKGTAHDIVYSYLTTILGFIGLTDVNFVFAEALNMGEEVAEENRKDALQQLSGVFG
ncbi:FMN-dependent NADH-azoreductase [Vibrio sp. HA2012]|uniref:FMN-dependent NADH-azoreductase n=1 Tax=Vibrio sp. HA2012 TaxID=1971595 RepID=UPI000C2BFE5F|nr:FMN-dependent NADH-azoreductase [Vibrio sp. HA2012]PJC86752.1 FMN-dependent NADH-azoreductase [Vibrio sp. HA2012]